METVEKNRGKKTHLLPLEVAVVRNCNFLCRNTSYGMPSHMTLTIAKLKSCYLVMRKESALGNNCLRNSLYRQA